MSYRSCRRVRESGGFDRRVRCVRIGNTCVVRDSKMVVVVAVTIVLSSGAQKLTDIEFVVRQDCSPK
jgi:hypothetical protein